MPKRRATRVKNHAKPKKPEGDIGGHLDPEERKKKLEVFLTDFDMEVKKRLQKIEVEKIRIQSIIEKEINVQLGFLPPDIRNMNIMDFVAAGGTVEAALMKLNEIPKDDCDEADFVPEMDNCLTAKKKERGLRRGKGTASKSKMAAATASTVKHRSRFQTPATRQLPPVWDTPAVTPKFDINLPFTPGFARAPRNGERLMSLAGSPVNVTTAQKAARNMKCTRIQEEDDESAISRVAATVPHIAMSDIHKILVAAKVRL